MRRFENGGVLRAAAFVAGVVVLAVLPRFLSDFRASEAAYVGIYFIAVMGVNIVTGYTGQVSLGHGAFMAVGGYTTAILAADHGVKDLYTIPLAGLVAGAVGFLFGIPALRLSGLYLALATFAVAVATPQLLKKAKEFTGGSEGINLFGLPQHTGGIAGVDVAGHHLTFNDWLYYLCWTIAAALLLVAWLVLRGRLGLAFRAVRDSEVAAASSGVNLALYKALAFGLSAFYAGVAGALFAIATTFVNPDTFPIILSVYLLIGAVVAGLGSLLGIVAGALFIQYLPVLAPHLSKEPGVPSVVYGLVLILAMLALPNGVAGLARRLPRALSGRRNGAEPGRGSALQ